MPNCVSRWLKLGLQGCVVGLGLSGLIACRAEEAPISSQSTGSSDSVSVTSTSVPPVQDQQSIDGTEVPIPGTVLHRDLSIVDENSWATIRKRYVEDRADDFSCSFELTYFQVENLEDPIVQDIVNAHLKTLAFETETPYLQPFDVEMCAQKIRLDKEAGQGPNSGYQYELHPMLYFNQDGILSIVYQYYEFPLDTSRHTTLRTINFDLRSGELLDYEDLFLPDADYENQVGQLIVQRFQDTLLPEEAERYQSGAIAQHQFYITEKGLNITNVFEDNIWNLTRVLLQPEDISNLLNPSPFSDVLLAQGVPPNTSEPPTCILTAENKIENDIAGTGYLEFAISNPVGNPPQEAVLVEVLMLYQDETDEDEIAVRFNTWFRDRQGIALALDSPLAGGETQHVEWGRKYLQPWTSVELKTCQWFSPDDYLERYPELVNYPMP